MNDDRSSGYALIAGSVGTMITMALHPTAHDVMAPGQLGTMLHLNVAVHSLALFCLPILFLGALGLSSRLEFSNRAVIAALVFYAFALVAVMSAAVSSGLIAPGLIRQLLAAQPATDSGWRIAAHYNGAVNQAFAAVFVVGSSVAILLWSVVMLRRSAAWRNLGFYGCVAGPLITAAMLSGHLRLNVHGFGVVALCEAIWFIVAGVLLCQDKTA